MVQSIMCDVCLGLYIRLIFMEFVKVGECDIQALIVLSTRQFYAGSMFSRSGRMALVDRGI